MGIYKSAGLAGLSGEGVFGYGCLVCNVFLLVFNAEAENCLFRVFVSIKKAPVRWKNKAPLAFSRIHL